MNTERSPRRCILARVAIALLASIALGLGLLHWLAPLNGDALAGARPAPSSVIVDRHGERLYELMDPHSGAQRAIPLEEMPLHLRQAVIATEDASFYRNPGFSPPAILRALWLNLRQGEIVSGASTITQQVARQMLLPEERYEQSLGRKVREAWLAFRLTRTLAKDEILALYLNESYFGNLAYGVEAAARAYFAKPAAELNLAESAMLAGLLQAPAAYNPLTHPEAARERQATVLALMARAGYITAEAASLAAREPLRYGSAHLGIRAPHFVMLVREELERILDEEALSQGGLTIRTTLDWGLQQEAELQVRRHLAKLNQPTSENPGHRVRNAAVVALSPDGAVQVMVGSPAYFDASIDGAVNAALALRQPGSALKPFTYAAAFERGLSPATVISDVRTSFQTAEGESYVPINYDHIFRGPVSLREALGSSYNVVAVRVLDRIGPQALADMARRVGIDSLSHPERQGLALTLGGGEVRLLQLTGAYAALAQGGQLVQPYLISEVRDAQDRLLYAHTPPEPQQALDPRIAYLVTDILADPQARIPSFGYGSVLELPFPAAAKTGTTNNWRDNWTLGYTTAWTVGVWVGNADGAPMERATGITGAGPIWNTLMRRLHRTAPAPFVRPEGLVEVEVCAGSGKLPGPACHHRRQELFLPENVPTETCDMHRLVELDALTGAPATDETPAERRILRAVTYWPADALAWAVDQGLPLPPEMARDADGGLGADNGSQGDGDAPYLVSPDPRAVYRLSRELPPEHQQLEVAAVCAACAPGDELRLWLDGEVIQVWTAPPYRMLWPLQEGEHVFSATRHIGQEKPTESASVEITVLAETFSRGETP
jgi:penicillin-binding protein 1C